ncbi:hypothetical protein GCM10010910_06110 [Microbacterium nanhaiense]|uniref:DUF2273 domain-containing protein n=1 Tax=Microbacterium nanhaiense TaxID=1301026 RepID=A0ABQ2MX28_9MICO|nr:hypothetical protein [Microbacterium nanhaiense]GGO60507.1 hypothetical protein GCM10010910_06110 [Microbacterium nanhaiense]
MSAPVIGASAGAVLVLTWIALGFGAFVLVAVGMLVGALIGMLASRRIDVRALLDAFRGSRSSS